MKTKRQTTNLFLLLICCGYISLHAQINPGVYFSKVENTTHELKVGENYLIHTIYEKSPAKFIKTIGGYYTIKDGTIQGQLEFNSNFDKDSISKWPYKIEIGKDDLTLFSDDKLKFKVFKNQKQDLDGEWLFGTRGPDKGQERRGDTKPRKTLKYLQNGRFQWIAYNIETMKFHGTGGGAFTSEDGVYQENIEFFSRDNSRVGAELKFDFELKENDWHHQGNNSRGEPMYEIWMRRMVSSQ